MPGVGSVRWYGGARREIQVLLDLAALESRNLSINEVLQAISRENQTLRGGKIEEGNSRMLVRTVGQFTSTEEIARTVIKNGPDGPIRMGDVATIADTYKETERLGRNAGHPAVFMSISKKSGANTLDVVQGVTKEIANVNRDMNINRGVNIDRDIDINRDIDVDLDYDRWGHPVARGVAAGVATSIAIGTAVAMLPSGCTTVVVDGIGYSQCGSTWYEPYYSGTTVQYVVVNPPQ